MASKPKPTLEKRPKGRPTLYKPEFAELAFKFCLLGATNDKLAQLLDVSPATIDVWLAGNAEFLGAVKAGRDEADANVSKSLYHRALGYSHEAVKIVADAKTGAEHIVPFTEHYPPDTTAAIFWLKNRQRDQWREKTEQTIDQRTEHSGTVNVVSGLSDRLSKVRQKADK